MSLLQTLGVASGQYRYLTCLGRLVGANGIYQRTDADKSQVLQQESAANAASERSGNENVVTEKDYTEIFTINAIGETYRARNGAAYYHGNEVEVFMPLAREGETDGRHWTHYPIYRTQNILSDTADLATVTETYLWAKDIQAVKSFVITGIFDSKIILSPEMSFDDYFTMQDLGATFKTLDGREMKIIAFEESLSGAADSKYRSATVSYLDGTPVDDELSFVVAHIGGGDQMIFDRAVVDANTAEYTIKDFGVNSSYVPSNDLVVGNQIVFYNGETAIIKYRRLEGADTVLGVFERDGEPEVATGDAPYIGVINPTSRIFFDITSDDQLQARKESGEPLYFLQTRFFEALPNGKLGAVAGGAYFTTTYKNGEYYYCSLRNLYRAGYYHPAFQYNDKPVGSITRLKAYPNSLCIFGKNFTYYLDPTIILNSGEERVGEYIPTFTDPRLITDRIGVYTESNSAKVENGGEFLLTGEPAVRFFDGYRYGENIADGKIQSSKIVNFYHAVVMWWTKRLGLKMVGIFKGVD